MKKIMPVFIIVILFLSGCSSLVTDEMIQTAIAKTQFVQITPSQTITSTTEFTPTNTITQTPKPTSTPQPEYFFGDTVIKDGIAITALSIEDPFTQSDWRINPSNGNKFVKIEIKVENLSSNNVLFSTMNPSNQVKDQNGFVYPVKIVSLNDSMFEVNLAKNEKITHNFVFEMPIDSIPLTIQTPIGFFNPIMLIANLRTPPTDHILVNLPDQPYLINPSQSPINLVISDFNPSATPQYYSAPPTGFKYVAFFVEMENQTMNQQYYIHSGYFYLLDNKGYIYPSVMGISGEIQSVNINIGEKTKGWVMFSIPENVTPIGLKYGNSPDENYVYAKYP